VTARPPWWPETEAWPPRRHALHRRRRFFRLFAIAAMIIVALSIYGVVSLAAMLAAAVGLITRPAVGGLSLLLVGIGVGVAVAAAMVVSFARRVVLPIGAVMDAAERVAAGDYTTRVAEHGPRAIRGLARSFNTMTARLESHDRIRRDLMADVAHELRTPLTIVQGKIEGLLDGVYARDDGQLGELLEETRLLSRLVEDLRTLALTESGGLKLQKEPTDIVALARGAVRAFDAEASSRGVTLGVEVEGGVGVLSIDPVRIREVLGNLLSNALRHTPSGGRVDVLLRGTDGAVTVAVRDSGEGMSPDELARAFDRFQKGRASHGSGLGLAIARNLVRAHGGDLTAASQPGQGTTMTMFIPNAKGVSL
jgi:signal transduction histidine kinase